MRRNSSGSFNDEDDDDVFEDSSKFEMITPTNGKDYLQTESCCICFTEEEDKLLYCNGCNMRVHEGCYDPNYYLNANEAVDRLFYCVTCSKLKYRGKYIKCEICPNLGGALVRVQTSKENPHTRFIHYVCVNFTSELYFLDQNDSSPENLCVADCVENSLKKRKSLRCSICTSEADKTYGACVQCIQDGCYVAFHAYCGILAGYATVNVNRESHAVGMYCEKHSRKRQTRRMMAKSPYQASIGTGGRFGKRSSSTASRFGLSRLMDASSLNMPFPLVMNEILQESNAPGFEIESLNDDIPSDSACTFTDLNQLHKIVERVWHANETALLDRVEEYEANARMVASQQSLGGSTLRKTQSVSSLLTNPSLNFPSSSQASQTSAVDKTASGNNNNKPLFITSGDVFTKTKKLFLAPKASMVHGLKDIIAEERALDESLLQSKPFLSNMNLYVSSLTESNKTTQKKKSRGSGWVKLSGAFKNDLGQWRCGTYEDLKTLQDAVFSLDVHSNWFPTSMIQEVNQFVLVDYGKAKNVLIVQFEAKRESKTEFIRLLHVREEKYLALFLQTLHLILEGENDFGVETVVLFLTSKSHLNWICEELNKSNTKVHFFPNEESCTIAIINKAWDELANGSENGEYDNNKKEEQEQEKEGKEAFPADRVCFEYLLSLNNKNNNNNEDGNDDDRNSYSNSNTIIKDGEEMFALLFDKHSGEWLNKANFGGDTSSLINVDQLINKVEAVNITQSQKEEEEFENDSIGQEIRKKQKMLQEIKAKNDLLTDNAVQSILSMIDRYHVLFTSAYSIEDKFRKKNEVLMEQNLEAIRKKEAEANAHCKYCQSDESSFENPLILCEQCDDGAHLRCAGLRKVPEGCWFCETCLKKTESRIRPEDQEKGDVFCVCKTPYDAAHMMIACDKCEGWYHAKCQGFIICGQCSESCIIVNTIGKMKHVTDITKYIFTCSVCCKKDYGLLEMKGSRKRKL